ncbi:hypothetical protein [Bacillus sp. JJ722]|uniref:hypothetical protein n=1 Tax=Bacillus sp. JJ722 TaxID=3122973 RepID=UPI0030000964
MTIAEIHGKLSPFERMEDLLTSDVFSTFRYLVPNKGLIPFLKRAVRAVDKSNPDFLSDVEEAEYIFWPRTIKLNREPDLLIVLTKKGGSTISLLIESKYTSGKSNLLREEEQTNIKDHMDGDQLAELYKELQEGNIHIENRLVREKFTESYGNRYLFYVTSHYALPKKDFDESFKILEKKQHGIQPYKHFYWVNWMCIIDVIEEVNANENWAYAPAMRFLLADLKDLLYKKKLIPFYGFSNLHLYINSQKFFFWEESVIEYDQQLFSGIKAITQKNVKQYFWMGE